MAPCLLSTAFWLRLATDTGPCVDFVFEFNRVLTIIIVLGRLLLVTLEFLNIGRTYFVIFDIWILLGWSGLHFES